MAQDSESAAEQNAGPEEATKELHEYIQEQEIFCDGVGQELQPGDPVRLVDLASRPEMNGLTGTLVEMRDNRWQVKVDGLGNRLLRAKNLQLIIPEGAALSHWEVEFSPGDFVQIIGLDKEPEFNEKVGTIVEQQQDRWLVQLEGIEEGKLFKCKNLQKVTVDDDIFYTEWDKDFIPNQMAVVGSWDDWTTLHWMTWDVCRSCYQFPVTLGSSRKESFQLFIDGDPTQCCHPDREEADCHTGFTMYGPHEYGEGFNWTIGKHPYDNAYVGAAYEIQLLFGQKTGLAKVHWVPLRENLFGAVEEEEKRPKAPSLALEKAAQAYEQPPLQPNRVTLATVLKAAKPDWSKLTIDSVIDKLAKVEIESGVGLIQAILNEEEHGTLTSRLKAVGEKAFAGDTLQALRDKAAQMEVEISWREGVPTRKRPEEPVEAPKIEPKHEPELDCLPVQTFRVINEEQAFVRERPTFSSPAFGKKYLDDVITVKEQTFDNWVRLVGEPGWLPLYMSGKNTGDIFKVLEPEGATLPLTIPEPADKPGAQLFVVVDRNKGIVRTEPSETANILEFKREGEQIAADTQTYHGWIRIKAGAPSNVGWLLSSDPSNGKLRFASDATKTDGWMCLCDPETRAPWLRCPVLERKRERRTILEAARDAMEQGLEQDSPNVEKIIVLWERAKDLGLMDKTEIKKGEATLEEIRQREEKLRKQKKLEMARDEISAMEHGPTGLKAEALQAALARAKIAGMEKEELQVAEKLLEEIRGKEAEEHRVLTRKREIRRRINAGSVAGHEVQLRGCIDECIKLGFTQEAETAQTLLNQLLEKQEEAKKSEMQQRMQKAATDEKELLKCIDDAAAAGYAEEAEKAKKMYEAAIEEKKNRSSNHATLLQDITDAARSGDIARVKATREAAKKAGISMKDIGKAYAAAKE